MLAHFAIRLQLANPNQIFLPRSQKFFYANPVDVLKVAILADRQ